MSELVNYARHGEIGVITINNPPVNALSPGVPEGIMAAIEAAEQDPEVSAIVLIGGGRTFIAGADIKEFGKVTGGEKPRISLNPVLEQNRGFDRSRWSWRFTAPRSAAAWRRPWPGIIAWRSRRRRWGSRR